MEMSVYVGPYIRCTNERVVRPEEIPHACANRDCKGYACTKHSDTKFCALCGCELTTVVIEREQDAVSDYKVAVEILGERVSAWPWTCPAPDPTVQIYTSNRDWGAGRKTRFDRSDDHLEIMLNDPSAQSSPEDEVEKFSAFHAEDIAVIREHYPAVQVCWGILTWWG